ncbi:MAG: hypothetical protein WKF50_08165 [Nocardioides sp.]
MSASVSLIRHTQSLAMVMLPAGATVPDWAEDGLFLATIRTSRGTVVVCRAAAVPLDVESHGPFTAFELSHDLDPSEPGLLSLLGTVPGRVGISLLPYTAFDRGWLLVQRADADRVQTLWEQSGITITTPEDKP